MRMLKVAIAGLGSVGQQIVKLLAARHGYYLTKYHYDVRIVGVCTSKGGLISEQGLSQQQILTKSQTLSGIVAKIKNSWQKKQGQYDFSHEVMEAMEGCLACKACAGQCPIKVDVPSFRARFIQLYHSRYLRPAKDYLVGNIERSAPLLASMPKVVNFFLQQGWMASLLKKTVGYVDTPQLSVPTLKQRVGSNYSFDLTELQALPEAEKQKLVLLVPTFLVKSLNFFKNYKSLPFKNNIFANSLSLVLTVCH